MPDFYSGATDQIGRFIEGFLLRRLHAQLDLGAGAFGNNALGNATGHFFWRDPDKGLIGAYGSGLNRSGFAGGRFV